MSAKKRVLICGEFSLLMSGYARMSYAILSHLAKTEKYELAEFANYCWPMEVLSQKDPRSVQAIQSKIKWKLYPTMPFADEENVYNSNPLNQFGCYRFEDVVNNFRPQIIISWLDVWMTTHLFRSPFRDFYKLILMPAIDGTPQQREWVSIYQQADKLITYGDWASEVLKEFDIDSEPNSPGVDIQTYFPSHKKINYNSAGRADGTDMIVIGTVMRNQKRKLFPDLIRAFEKFIYYCKEKGNKRLAENTYLYLHTSFPDLGWALDDIITQSKVGHRILFTYQCRTPGCNSVFPSLWADARTNCPSCHKFSAVLPSTQNAVDDAVLSNIINTFDIYAQVSALEGFGIPLIEAASCGVPAIATDYSAMEDVIRKLKGIPLKVERFYKESETGRDFALPSDDHFVEELYKFLNLPEPVRKKKGFDARKAVEKYYTWHRACKKWEEIIDGIEIESDEKTWNSPPRYVKIDNTFLNNPAIQNATPKEFLQKCKENIIGDLLDSDNFRLHQLLKQLNYNMSLQQVGGPAGLSDMSFLGMRQNMGEYNGQKLLQELTEMANNWNKWETNRTQGYVKPRFLGNVFNGK